MVHGRADYNDKVICVKSKKAVLEAVDVLRAQLNAFNLNVQGEIPEDVLQTAHDKAVDALITLTDALNGKIPDSEPVFLLRGQDQLAPHIIGQWANILQSTGQEGASIMSMAAIRHSEKMLAWRPRKLPDLPKPGPGSTPDTPNSEPNKVAETDAEALQPRPKVSVEAAKQKKAKTAKKALTPSQAGKNSKKVAQEARRYDRIDTQVARTLAQINKTITQVDRASLQQLGEWIRRVDRSFTGFDKANRSEAKVRHSIKEKLLRERLLMLKAKTGTSPNRMTKKDSHWKRARGVLPPPFSITAQDAPPIMSQNEKDVGDLERMLETVKNSTDLRLSALCEIQVRRCC
jgi:hypothetical protein